MKNEEKALLTEEDLKYLDKFVMGSNLYLDRDFLDPIREVVQFIEKCIKMVKDSQFHLHRECGSFSNPNRVTIKTTKDAHGNHVKSYLVDMRSRFERQTDEGLHVVCELDERVIAFFKERLNK